MKLPEILRVSHRGSIFVRRAFVSLVMVLSNVIRILRRIFSKWTRNENPVKENYVSADPYSLDETAEWLEFEEWRLFKGCPSLEIDRIALECLGQPLDEHDAFFNDFIIVNAVVEAAAEDESLIRIRVQAVRSGLLKENFLLH
mgnify:CR=1 FL=1